MAFIINSLTEAQQLANATALMASLKNADGSLMFRNLQNAILVQSTLRGEIQLNTSNTSYNVPVLQNSQGAGVNAATPTSNLLSLQDAFVCTSISVQIAKKASLTDTAFGTYTYAPASVFSTAGTATAAIGMFSNGYLKYTNNQQVVAPYWDLRRHYNVPFQQPATAAYYTGSNINYIGSVDASTDGFYPVQPGWFFNGSGNVQLTLNLPGALAAVETYEFAILYFAGFLLQNASTFK